MKVYHTDGYKGVLVDYKEFTYHVLFNDEEMTDYDLQINVESMALKVLIKDLKECGMKEI